MQEEKTYRIIEAGVVSHKLYEDGLCLPSGSSLLEEDHVRLWI